ncbi:MAG: hypothetical protein GX234_01430 [Clostridiales bacterium]|nr:hypothetical protein [Clostridiales bacterium]
MKDSRKLRYRLKKGKLLHGIYVIALSEGRDELDIYHCALFRQSFFRKNPRRVVGLADSHEEAVELVVQIVQDIFSKTGEYKIKSYLEKQFKNK